MTGPAGATEPSSTPASRGGAAEHRRRLDRALAELAGDDSDPAPPRRSARHALARAGIRLRPPAYYGLLGACAWYALVLTPTVGALLWAFVWRHDEVRLQPMVTSSLQIGLALGVATGLLSWLIARARRLSRWHEL